MSKEIFDFSKVPVSSETTYLKPGQYRLNITDTKFVKPDGKKPDGSPKTPYLEFTFSGKAGQTTQKFYVTPAAFERIQNLHMYWFDKTCDKAFESTEQIGVYFESMFNHAKAKAITRNVIIGGRTGTDGKVYAEIGFRRFVVPDSINGTEFEEKEYVPGTPEWILNVKAAPITPATNNDSVMLTPSETPVAGSKQTWDDLPF